MKKALTGFFSFFIIAICAQIKFEKGYIISSDNTKKKYSSKIWDG